MFAVTYVVMFRGGFYTQCLGCIGVLFMGTMKIITQDELSHDWKKTDELLW